MWRPDGSTTKLPMPTVDGVEADTFQPTSIRGGRVAGHAGVKGQIHDVRYRISTGTFEELPGNGGYRMRINPAGWVLREPELLTITRDAGVLTLPTVKELPGKPIYQLVSLSDDGRVAAGHGYTGEVDDVAVMWRCR